MESGPSSSATLAKGLFKAELVRLVVKTDSLKQNRQSQHITEYRNHVPMSTIYNYLLCYYTHMGYAYNVMNHAAYTSTVLYCAFNIRMHLSVMRGGEPGIRCPVLF